MSEINYEAITKSMAQAVLQGETKIALGKISSIEMPEPLREKMLERGEKVIEEEIDRFLQNPFFNFSGEDEEVDVQAEMNKLLADKIVIPAESVVELVSEVFKEIMDEWQTDPISFREAAEDLGKFADEIFHRIENYTSFKPGDSGFDLDLIACLCDMSGMDSVAMAIQLESKLGVEHLNREDLMLITDRFFRLVKQYKVDRRLTSFVGAGRTLFSSTLPPELEPPGEFDKGLLEDDLTTMSDLEEEDETFKEDFQKEPEPGFASVKDDLDFGIEDDGRGPTSLEDMLSNELDGSDAPAIDSNKEADEEILDMNELSNFDLNEPGQGSMGSGSLNQEGVKILDEPESVEMALTVDSELARSLMEENTRKYFINELFDGDNLGYKMMAERICQASDLNRALIIADNELFMLDIPAVAEQASRLMNLIREKYAE